MLETPKLELVHLDISFNGLTVEDLLDLNDAISNNYTLFGIHIEGN